MSLPPFTPNAARMSLPRVAQHQVVLDEDGPALEVGHAVLADEDEVGAARALPVEEHVAAHGDPLVADLAVVAGVASPS